MHEMERDKQREEFAVRAYIKACPPDFDEDGNKTDWRYDEAIMQELERVYQEALREYDRTH